ncbi:MAG: YncE family protein [Longimicrobiales bacterium]|nr:YncE family protein [Longimicrobiales bacterium]
MGVQPLDGQAPDGLPGTLVVLNKRGNDASFVDLASGRIVATAPTGVGPHELAISSDGRTGIVTDYEGPEGTLTVLDIPAGRRVRTISLAPYTRPHGIAYLPGDSLVAVTVEQDRAVLLVRVPEGGITAVLSTGAEGSHMVAATGDGGTLWTGDIGSNTVTELDVATRSRVRSLPAPAQPEAVNVTADGARVFAGSNATGKVTVFDTRSGTSRTVAEGFGWPYRMFLTPAAGQLIVPDMREDVLRFFDGDSYRELGRIPFPEQGPQGLTLHPDGRHLFLSLSQAGRVAVVDIAERRVVAHLPAGSGPDGVGFSPHPVSR